MPRFLSLSFILLVLPSTGAAAIWTLGHSGGEDFSTLYEACAAAAAGDSILISPGYYDESDQWIILEQKPIRFVGMGTSPDRTSINLRIGIHDCEGVLFENISLRDSPSQTSVFLYGTQGEATVFRNCTFRNNAGPVIWTITMVTVTIEDCIFSGNRADGQNGRGGALKGVFHIRRCLFVDNAASQWGGAVYAENSSVIEECVFVRNEASTGAALAFATDVDVHNCTFLANVVTGVSGGAIEVLDNTYDKTINHCVIAGTVNGYGVACSGSGAMECCDFWDNDLGPHWDWWCFALPEKGNIFVDPLFCDVLTGDVGLLPGSPCLPGNHGGMDCGLIGARDVGCGIVPVREITWGKMKTLFR
jgi:hypothetical protein